MFLSSSAQAINRYDIVIDELFPDPSPAIGLPEAEFIELKNISSSPINLRNWKIGKRSGTTIIKTDFILVPDSFVVICSAQAGAAYSSFGAAISIAGFPSLGNTGDTIYLQSPEGMIIHALAYDKSWYQNEVKAEGGWTLEMIDTKNPCSGYNNWTASTDSRGGTPGMRNAVDGNNPDQQSPALLRTYTPDSLTIIAVFDEPLDSTRAALSSDYLVDNVTGSPVSAMPLPPLFNEVQLKLPSALKEAIVYQLTVNNLTDCKGNTIGGMNTAKSGLPVLADTGNIVINEIVFNPKPGGYDYVELYNRSNKVIDLEQLYVAGRDPTGSLNSIKPLTSIPYLFFPGEYYAVTENSLWVQQNYLVKYPDKMLELSQLPSLPDDEGELVLLNQQGTVIDELHYNHKWHFALIDNEEGIALERIDYNKPTQTSDNWTSAASTAGFGTPTYQNSQLRSNPEAKGEITLMPKIFSPDNDGYDDYCFINYQLTAPGSVANIAVFDISGRPVRYLAKNATLGLTGNFRWDGLDENQRKLPVGIYIVVTEIFDLQGNTKKWKHAVTLARRFN
jgi:hypothetical protein